MKNISILIFSFLISTSLFSQSFRVPKNVVSTSLFQPFASISGYTISFERLIDPGYSLNAAQFSYKLNTTLISYNQKKSIQQLIRKFFMTKRLTSFLALLFYLK